MIVEDKTAWKTKYSDSVDVDVNHALVNSFKYFHLGDDNALLVNNRLYSTTSRLLNDNEFKHQINSDKDVLYKICKLRVIYENEPLKLSTTYKIIYFRNVDNLQSAVKVLVDIHII